MLFISEAESAALISEQLAFDAVRDSLVAAVAEHARTFPAVAGHGSDPRNEFAIKSAASGKVAGLKVGSYWPGNAARGLARHSSLIMLLDQDTGRVGAVIEAGEVNAYRTAAADAVAAAALARPDAASLAIFGSGHQALYECLALSRIRPVETIHVVARDPGRGADFVAKLAARSLHAVPAQARDACRSADIIVTATTASAPLFDARWVRPGTHVASMGSDRVGKQELPVALLERARLFCDLPSQSTRIGELQHIADEVAAGELAVTSIGAVLAGRAAGRGSNEEITVFDSSGIALQDLYVAAALVEEWRRRAPAFEATS
ncbi:ornithine cyclodeaminase family protein [Actinophytocola sp.]|jgi:ornithine cyclodeaminase|uniref:ornithine cyclodeaminase family protein n=1 Tax=Actinophytocola sp. TaxID=1872138 RepID=UPI002EDAA595